MRIVATPIKMIAVVPGLDRTQARLMADLAVQYTRDEMPRHWRVKRRIVPIWDAGYFGISWSDSYVWFQDQGISAFTMNSLKGKTIPMWVTDENGKLRFENPKIKQRIRDDGVVQVLIFRKATKPGAPGRISKRNPNGQIAKGNVGVKWRHPGLEPRHFLSHGIRKAASRASLIVSNIMVIDHEDHAVDYDE